MERCIHRHTKDTHPACFRDQDALKGFIIPDVHFPKHDVRAYNAVMEYAKDFKPDLFINLGDLGDFSGVSHWNSKRYRVKADYPVKRDLDMCYEHHRLQREISPKSEIYTIGGNHDEEWPDRWLEDHPEMIGYFDYERDMGFKDFNVKYIKRKDQPLKIGKLRFVHGWFCNLHHAKKHAEHIHNNIVYGHAHDVQMFTPKNYEPQHRFTSICLGHLSDEKKAEYLRNQPTNWILAFGVFYMDRVTGEFTIYPIMLPNRRFYGLDGKLYKG